MTPESDKASVDISKISCNEKSVSRSIIADTAFSLSLSWLKRDVEASSFIPCTMEFALLDNIEASSTSKQLSDYQQSQYGE